MENVPPGFTTLFRTSPFLENNGPFYQREENGGLIIAVRIAEKHTNARGFAHGGLLMTMADIALGYNLAIQQNPPGSLITTSMTTDFANSAKLGDWVEVRVDVQKRGSRLAFANAYLTVEGERIVRSSGVFLVVTKD